MRKSEPSTGSRLLKAGIAVAATAAVVVGGASPASAAAVPMTLSSTTGPSGGLNTLTGTTAQPVFTATSLGALFSVTTCPANYTTTPTTVSATAGVIVVSTAADVRKLGTNKVSVKVPSGVALPSGSTTLKFNVCIYNGRTAAAVGPPAVTGSPLVASGAYTIAKAPTLANADWLAPAAGPALGGTKITVTGTNFTTTGLTATLGGTPLTGIVVAADGTSFTATTPAHMAEDDVTLAVTTSGGTVSKPASFDYMNGVVVSPNTAPTNTAADVSVMGAGLGDMFAGWTTPANASTATPHIYLVDGNYDATDNSNNKTRGPTQDCGAIAVIGPTEVVCTFDLTTSLSAAGASQAADVDNGTYTVTVVNDGTVDANNDNADYTETIITSGATFTVAPY